MTPASTREHSIAAFQIGGSIRCSISVVPNESDTTSAGALVAARLQFSDFNYGLGLAPSEADELAEALVKAASFARQHVPKARALEKVK